MLPAPVVNLNRVALNQKQTIQLSDLLRAAYVDQQKPDEDFAEWASKELKFRVTKANVTGLRRVLEIAAFEKPKARYRHRLTKEVTALTAQVQALEKRVALLEDIMAPADKVKHLGTNGFSLTG